MDSEKTLLILNSTSYRLGALLKTIRTCPMIEVPVDQLNAFIGTEVNPEHVVTTVPELFELADFEIVFYKQHGKYTVLAGQKNLAIKVGRGDQVLRGRLVSTPGLKKHRVEPEPAVPAVRPYVDILAHHGRVHNPPRFVPSRRDGPQRDGSHSGPFGNYDAPRRTYDNARQLEDKFARNARPADDLATLPHFNRAEHEARMTGKK